MVSPTKLIGVKRDKLEVVDYLGKLKYNKHWWKCKCDCGNYAELTSAQVKSGPISCGCYRTERLLSNRFNGYKHGLHKHRLYTIYHSMKHRCENPKNVRYQYYGGKGVRVCPEWREFTEFYKWAMENGYEDHLSIDRIDSNGDYEPNNCQWITLSENTKRCNETKFRRNDGTFAGRTEKVNQEA